VPPELIEAHKKLFASDVETRKKHVDWWRSKLKFAEKNLKLAEDRLEEAITRKLDADYKSQQQTRG
jgi:hypothetical protein